MLHRERGFSSQVVAVGGPTPDPWSVTDAASIPRDVLITVMPDEDSGEAHPWQWLLRLLSEHGVATTETALREAAYVVEFGPVLRQRLRVTRPLRRASR